MPASRSPLADLLADLRQVLAEVGARWYLFGAQAAIFHGAARLTADVDITVDQGAHTAGELAMALGAAGFEPRVGDVAAFAEANRVLPLVHARTRIPVDVVLAGPGLEDLFFATHEIGHSIGLDHTGVPCSLMNPFYSEVCGALAADDFAGGVFIYGPPGPVDGVPFPATLVLVGLGLLGLGVASRKRRA